VTPSAGIRPYTFVLDGGAPVTGNLSYSFFGVGSGLHTIQVTDAIGCQTIIYSVTVPFGPVISTTATKTNVLCNGGATGSITVAQPVVGAGPYTYSLDAVNWQISRVFTGLAAGTYTVFFRSVNGCQNSLSMSITEPAPLAATAAMVAARCNGEANGTITVTPSGGISPYQYSIDGGAAWQSNPVFTKPAGTYTIQIRDANNCITTRSVTVTEPAPLTAFSNNSNASCDGGNDGKIIVNAAGGNAGYRYSLDGVNFGISNIFSVNPGSYTVWVKDNLGCLTSFTTTVGLTVNLFLTPQNDLAICEGTSQQLQTNSNATIYTWTPHLGLNDTTLANPTANPVTTTEYRLRAILGRCTAYDTVLVRVNTAPIPNAGPDGDICYGQSYILQGTGGAQYNWTPAIYLNTTVGANPVSTPTLSTQYTLSVIDAIGCRSLITDNVRVVVKRTMKVNTYPFDTIGHPGDQFRLLATSPGISYVWSPSTGLSNTMIADPVATLGALGSDITYQVVATDINGCKGEGYVTIRIYTGPDIYVPTGFTPDGDGKNDTFLPVPVGIKSYNYFRVFNRWGQLIFSTVKQNTGWDGTMAGKEQATGVYVWTIEGITKDNRLITKKGTVTLIR
jgi:gliding motility-associated-like protein